MKRRRNGRESGVEEEDDDDAILENTDKMLKHCFCAFRWVIGSVCDVISDVRRQCRRLGLRY